MTNALDQSILELLRASRDDEETVHLGINDRSLGFHVQQAIEKLIKALIGGHAKRYEFTHDLGVLVRAAEALDERLPVDAKFLEGLNSYAGVWRYQEPPVLTEEVRLKMKEDIVTMRLYVLDRLMQLRPGFDWHSVFPTS